MTQTHYSSRTQPDLHASAAEVLPSLRVAYVHGELDALLAADDVLAVIGFGSTAPNTHADPRYVHVALQTFEARAPFEVWRANAPVRRDTCGALRWARDDDYAFGALELDEREYGGLTEATEAAYAMLGAHFATSAMPHPLRIWNYLDAINLGVGDAERYRQFCGGRAAGMRHGFATGYPAATAIGVRDGRRVLQIYWLAARARGAAVENPRQMNAWRYPRQYGPQAPSFARAMRAPTKNIQLYISGTASIVGHASQHHDDLPAQVNETLANIDSLLAAAETDMALRGGGTLLKAYVRREQDLAAVAELLRIRLRADIDLLFLHGDICRRELLIEIDGVQSS